MDFNYSCDVAVAGGGIAGVAAAVAAARRGKKTVLIEKTVFPGGLATTGLVFIYLPICDGNGTQVSFGLTDELLKLSRKYGPSVMHEDWHLEREAPEAKRLRALFAPAAYIMALDELLEEAGVEVWYDTVITGVEQKNGAVSAVRVNNKSGNGIIEGGCFIDATGDADLAFYAGAECVCAKNSLSFWTQEYCKGCPGNFVPDIQIAMLGASDYDTGKNCNTEGVNGRWISEFITSGRRLYRRKLDDFYARGGSKQDIFPLTLPAMAQLRRTRRIAGEFTMDDSMLWQELPRPVGVCADWRKHTKVWELSYGALLPAKLDNLLAAGRCISASGEAWTVTRVIPVAAQTGEIAGIAAAMALENGCTPRELPYEKLAAVLRDEYKLPLRISDFPGIARPPQE